MKKPPVWLPPTTHAPIQVQLIIGSFTYDPFEHTLFDLQLPHSQPAPQHPDEDMYGVRPEIAHTFRPEQKVPPKFISLIFTLAALGPWAVLFGLVRLHPD
jgi:oligosaccharyltransferase complex subunit delta (ribophorin II)